jgi:hypothetical protein
MKFIKNNFAVALAFLSLLIVSCNDDFLNTTPAGVPATTVWADGALAEAAVTDIYNGLGPGGMGEQMEASITDEAVFTHAGRGINTVNESRANSANTGWISGVNHWNNMYTFIRSANIAVFNLREDKLEDKDLQKRLLGEALFMRGYYYHQLVRYYGGVPLISEALSLETDYTTIARSPMEDCINFIVTDLDEAASLLSGITLDKGRASHAAALALKARILTYAASDLFDASVAASNSATLSGFSNPEILGYTSGSQTERWAKAKAASKAVIDLGTHGYKFGLGAPEDASTAEQNYTDIYLSQNGGENDVIWNRQYVETQGWGGRQYGLFNGPNGYHNWAGNTPLQNLIDAYGMNDGSEFDWDDPAHSAAPYTDREPRFYATILYDGADWKPRPSDVTERDPADQIQTGQYELSDGSTHFGLDTRQGPIEDWNGTRSGYYVKKFIDPSPDKVDQEGQQSIPWPFIRYTEVVFNYIEALLEEGDEDQARNWLNQIRYRAGLPATMASGNDLVDLYRRERQKELVYEEHRFHDTRRWMIAPTTLGATARIIQITGTLKPGATVTKYKYSTDDYDYSYVPTDLDPGIENRLWLDKRYFLPIGQTELDAAPALIQNPGYD